MIGKPKDLGAQRFPIVAVLEATQRDHHLLDYWLAEWPHCIIHQRPSFSGKLYRGLHVFFQADLNFVKQMRDYYLPLLAVRGAAASSLSGDSGDHFFRDLYNAGGAALWQMPISRQIDLPCLALPGLRGELYLFEDDSQLRNLYRQICYFAGYSLRADFRSEEELTALLGEQMQNALYPLLLLINLSSERLRVGKFFSLMERFLYRHPHLRPRIRMVLTRDFSLPGGELQSVVHAARPYARRIFHPQEALFVLLEGLLLPRLLDLPGGRLEQILFGERLQFQAPLPASREYRALLPFLWLYDHLSSYCGQGALLAANSNPKLDREAKKPDIQ